MTLRIALAALSDEHQRLLVEAAFHALKDVTFSAEVADLAGVDHGSLAGENGFACQVVSPLFDAARAEDWAETEVTQQVAAQPAGAMSVVPSENAAEVAYEAYRERAGGAVWGRLPEANKADWVAVAAALNTIDERKPTTDEAMGISWWNSQK